MVEKRLTRAQKIAASCAAKKAAVAMAKEEAARKALGDKFADIPMSVVSTTPTLSADLPDAPDVATVQSATAAVTEDLPAYKQKIAKILMAIDKFDRADLTTKASLRNQIDACRRALSNALVDDRSPDQQHAVWMELLRYRFGKTFFKPTATVTHLDEMVKAGELVKVTDGKEGAFFIWVERTRDIRNGCIVKEHRRWFDPPNAARFSDAPNDLKIVQDAFGAMYDRTLVELRKVWAAEKDELHRKYDSGSLTLDQFSAGAIGHIILDIESGWVERQAREGDNRPTKTWMEGGTIVLKNKEEKDGKGHDEIHAYLVAFTNCSLPRSKGLFSVKMRTTLLVRPIPFMAPDMASWNWCPPIKIHGMELTSEARFIIAGAVQRAWRQQHPKPKVEKTNGKPTEASQTAVVMQANSAGSSKGDGTNPQNTEGSTDKVGAEAGSQQ